MFGLFNNIGKTPTEQVNKIVEDAVQVTELTLSKKGLTLLLIDGELTANEKTMRGLREQKYNLERSLADVKRKYAEYDERQKKLHICAARLQLIPDKIEATYRVE